MNIFYKNSVNIDGNTYIYTFTPFAREIERRNLCRNHFCEKDPLPRFQSYV